MRYHRVANRIYQAGISYILMHLIQVSIGYGHPQSCWGYSIVIFKMYDIANLLVSQCRAIGWGSLLCTSHDCWRSDSAVLQSSFLQVHLFFTEFISTNFWLNVILGNLNLAVLDNIFVIYLDIFPRSSTTGLRNETCLSWLQYWKLSILQFTRLPSLSDKPLGTEFTFE